MWARWCQLLRSACERGASSVRDLAICVGSEKLKNKRTNASTTWWGGQRGGGGPAAARGSATRSGSARTGASWRRPRRWPRAAPLVGPSAHRDLFQRHMCPAHGKFHNCGPGFKRKVWRQGVVSVIFKGQKQEQIGDTRDPGRAGGARKPGSKRGRGLKGPCSRPVARGPRWRWRGPRWALRSWRLGKACIHRRQRSGPESSEGPVPAHGARCGRVGAVSGG